MIRKPLGTHKNFSKFKVRLNRFIILRNSLGTHKKLVRNS